MIVLCFDSLRISPAAARRQQYWLPREHALAKSASPGKKPNHRTTVMPHGRGLSRHPNTL